MFIVLRQTTQRRMQAKLHEIKGELRQRRHDPFSVMGQWLRSVVQGHFQFYAELRNQRKLNAFQCKVYRLSLKDTAGDYKADVRNKVFTGFGVNNAEQLANGGLGDVTLREQLAFSVHRRVSFGQRPESFVRVPDSSLPR